MAMPEHKVVARTGHRTRKRFPPGSAAPLNVPERYAGS